MAKPSEIKDWEAKRAGIVGLGERSFHKSYYPQLRQNVERLERFHTLLDQTTDFVILVALPDGTVTPWPVAGLTGPATAACRADAPASMAATPRRSGAR